MATTTLVVPINEPTMFEFVDNECVVYKRSATDVYTQLGSFSSGNTWSCPQTTMVSTDRVQVNTRIGYLDGLENPYNSVVGGYTPALGTTILNAAVWTNMPVYDDFNGRYPETTIANITYGVVVDTTPPVLSGTLVATPGNQQVILSGPEASDAVGISKWQYRIGNGSWVDIANSADEEMPETTVGSLTNDVEYSFTVRALDAANNTSNVSNLIVATPQIPEEVPIDTLRSAPPNIIDRLEFRALDSNFSATTIIDAYESMIWKECFSDVGDFELHGAINSQLLSVLKDNAYIFNSVSSTLMVIENYTIDYDVEEGSTLTITGRSMDSILDRRVLDRSYTFLNATDRRISQIIHKLITDAYCDQSNAARYWDLLEVIDSTSVSSVSLPVDVGMQFTIGDNLLGVVSELCSSFNLGIKCEFSFQENKVKLTIYEGHDLSVQGPNMLVFSDLYSNLLTGKTSLTRKAEKNAGLVVGEVEDPTTKLPKLPQTISPGNFTGINRREVFIRTDLKDVVYLENDTERAMTDAEYIAALIQIGTKELNKADYRPYRDYDGEILEAVNCKYIENFNLGDIVGFWLPDFQYAKAKLESITFSDDSKNGKTLLPEFEHYS